MKQECPVAFVWLTWLGLPGVAVFLGFLAGWAAGASVLLVGIAVLIAYIRWFPHISRWIGYGSVADVPAVTVSTAAPKVTLYTASVCPFCPIVKRRLTDLQSRITFQLEEVDVTFRPQIIVQKGFTSVPVIEAGNRFLVGHATSAELAAFLLETPHGSGTAT